MVVQISQNTMDFLTQRRDKALQTVNDAQNERQAAVARRDEAQRLADNINALIADSQVVP